MGFCVPRIDTCAVRQSFTAHCKKFRGRNDNNQVFETSGVFFSAIKQYGSLKSRAGGKVPKSLSGILSRFEHAVSELDKSSSTGCSYLRLLGPTIGDALKWDGVAYDPDRLEQLKRVVEQRLRNLSLGISDFDPIKVFIKQEPHKLKKREEGLWRNISAVSPVDSLIDRMLFGPYMDEVVENYQSYPCKIGWSPTRGGYRYMSALFGKGKKISLDKSGWDWTVPSWLVDEWLRFMLWTLPEDNKFARHLFKMRFLILFEQAIFELGDHFRVQQKFKGFMKSGCFLTIFLNSLGQSMMHYAAMILLGKNPLDYAPSAIGDDTLQKFFSFYEEYREKLRLLGCQPKPAEISEEIEFAGFLLSDSYYKPAYKNKHLFNIKFMDENVATEALSSMVQLYAFDDEMYRLSSHLLSLRDASLVRPQVITKMWASGILDEPFYGNVATN
nr:putative RdRp [Rhodnius prolixus virus 6]